MILCLKREIVGDLTSNCIECIDKFKPEGINCIPCVGIDCPLCYNPNSAGVCPDLDCTSENIGANSVCTACPLGYAVNPVNQLKCSPKLDGCDIFGATSSTCDISGCYTGFTYDVAT